MSPNIYFALLAQAPVEQAGTSPWAVIGVAFIAALMGMGVVKLIGYLRKQDAEKEARQIIEILLRYGADPAIRNKSGKTPADYARNIEIRRLLSDSNAR